ncbi:MAG: hypothetical protein RJA95_151 [Verrucomicrobiota bacterium]|jgi:hypothetical protein
MSHHNPSDLLRHPEDRRSFIEKCAKVSFGLSVLPFFSRIAEAAEAPGASKAPNADLPGFGKAKRVIFLQLNGGMSHIDTFDPKTGASKGPGSIVSAKGDMQLTSYLPETAKISDKITVIRSMTAKVGVHASAAYLMRTGFEQRGTVQHPTLGAWAQHFLGASHKTLPSSVTVNRSSNHGNGWFPAAYSPLPILNPNDGLLDTKSPVGEAAVAKRSELLAQLDVGFGGKAVDENVKSYNEFYESTFQLMKSADLKAFDISAEPAEMRARYGKSKFGQGCLLARRLVENGVRFVEVAIGGWDMHASLDDRLTDVGGDFDRVYATLIQDLDAKGLLDSTLVVVATEFGRKPSFEGGGRGHHPLVFSSVLAGGGVKRGYVHGASDAKGYAPEADGVSPGSLHATIAHAAGLPVQTDIITPAGRPMQVGNKAAPQKGVFA